MSFYVVSGGVRQTFMLHQRRQREKYVLFATIVLTFSVLIVVSSYIHHALWLVALP